MEMRKKICSLNPISQALRSYSSTDALRKQNLFFDFLIHMRDKVSYWVRSVILPKMCLLTKPPYGWETKKTGFLYCNGTTRIMILWGEKVDNPIFSFRIG